MSRYNPRHRKTDIKSEKITLEYTVYKTWMHFKFYDEQLIYTFGTDEERAILSDYLHRIKEAIGTHKVVKFWSPDHSTFDVVLRTQNDDLVPDAEVQVYQNLCAEFKAFTDELGDKYFPVFIQHLEYQVAPRYEGFVISHDKDKNADDIMNPSPEKRHYHLVCHLRQPLKKSDPRVSCKLKQMVNADGKFMIIKYRFGFDDEGNAFPDNPILSNSDGDRKDIAPVRALREMLAYLVHDSAVSIKAVGKHAYKYEELYGFGIPDPKSPDIFHSGYCLYKEDLALDPLNDLTSGIKHKKIPNVILARYLELVSGFDPNSDKYWDQPTVQWYNEMALEWANSFRRFDDEIRKVASVSEMSNNDKVIKEIRVRYDMAVKKKLESMVEQPRLCVFIQTPPDFGKSATLDLALEDLGYTKDQIFYSTGRAKYGIGDRFDPFYRVLVFDDSGMYDPLTVCDNKPNRSSIQKRGKGFSYYCPDIIVIITNLSISNYAAEMTNLYGSDKNSHDPKLLDAFKSRLYVCHISDEDIGFRELIVDSKCTRGDENAIQVSIMFRRFKDMFNAHIGYYDPGFTDEEVIDRVDGDIDTFRYFMQCFGMKEDKLVDFLFENHDRNVVLPPNIDPDLFAYLVDRLFNRLLPRLKASGSYDRLNAVVYSDSID